MKTPFKISTKTVSTPLKLSEKEPSVVEELLCPESIDETTLTQAAGVFRPTNATEISASIQYALKNGHRPTLWSYQYDRTNEIQNATLIDLQSGMNRIEVDSGTKTVTFGSSATIGEVDDAMARHGLAVVGGTCAVLRLGGVVLGGGYGYLSAQYGLVADNLLSATVVLADGRILKVSDVENRDLFWGIRGSYTNLGICADFTLQAYPITSVFWGKALFPYERRSEVLDALDQIYHSTLSRKSCISLRFEMTRVGDKVEPVVAVYLFHNGEKQDAMTEFDEILAVPARSTELRMLPYNCVNRQLNQTLDHNSKLAFCSTGANIPPPSDLKSQATLGCDMMAKAFRSLKSLKSLVFGIDYRVQGNKVMERNVDEIAFAARHDGPIMYLRARWVDGQEDVKVREFVKGFGHKWRDDSATFKSEGLPGAYPGFCTLQDLSPEETFGPNYQRLSLVKAKYDPENVFNHEMWRKNLPS